MSELGSLESLALPDAEISDQGVEHLAKLKSLRSLYLGNQNLSDNALADLQRRLPTLVIHRPQ
jgi:hypothetical protein